ncbi:MAG: ubiquinol-cytochrome c reductase iron-sulfur subunit [Actinomycetia bacterium]|nr:ubiquinol-cytochrome c reductase iron-sulfur subunit [Actinomycetes bacterium]
MARAKDWIIAGLVLLLGRGSGGAGDGKRRLIQRRPASDRAELVVLLLLGLSSLSAIGFIVVYAFDSIAAQTQYLGLALGLALLFFAAALVVTGKELVPEEELVEEYPPPEHPRDQETVEQLVDEGVDGISRRGLLKLGLLGAGGTLGLAALVPALSFGPAFRIKELFATPWRKGRLLVDEANRPWKATDIREADFYTAFPAGADKELQGSPLVLVRLPKDRLALPADLAGYDADGIVAYSKICTHAGCAISMYRVPLFQPDEPSPALVCPCHYSTFDPAKGGTVLFGPAGRRLPMLPLQIDAKGYLRAKGNFDEAVGPSWWGVRNRKPS